MDNTNTKENILPNLKMPTIFYPIIIMIIFLIIMMCLIFFKVPMSISSFKSQDAVVANILSILFFSLIVFALCIIFLPSFKDLKTLFQQISNVTYVLLYTIFIILFFSLTSPNIINNYASYITPITIALGLFSFYKSSRTDYTDKFNINYERIKSIILLFCLITCYIVYYNIDPGGIISNYFGYTMLLTIIISAFAFVYLITVLTLPDNPAKTNSIPNIFNNYSRFSIYGSILFVIFLVIVTILISTYPGGFFQDKVNSPAVIILLLIICILWSIMLVVNLFPEIGDKTLSLNKMNLFKRALLILFGFVISGLIIFWLVYNIQQLSNQSSIVSFILNIALVIILLGLIYKTINVQFPSENSKKNGFFNVIINLLFYIPCLFSGLFDSIGKFFVGEYNATNAGSLIMLIIAIILFLLYFMTPLLVNKYSLQGGTQLVNKPVYTNSQYSLGTYETLNGSSEFEYTYAISLWLFLDAVGPNMNESYETYTSLLNFANKPNILYNGKTNTLMITMEQKNLKTVSNNKLTDFDENNNRIIYKTDHFLLQKWNNIIINYNGGVLDIFINGELVKSDIGVVPYYTLDNLTIGENNGIRGGICNVIYFKKPLTATNINNIYNSVKNITPPTTNDSNETIINNNVSQINNSVQTVI